MPYTLSTSIKQPIDTTIETFKAVCMNHKFGIVSEVDMQSVAAEATKHINAVIEDLNAL